jgi:hypothetical protein
MVARAPEALETQLAKVVVEVRDEAGLTVTDQAEFMLSRRTRGAAGIAPNGRSGKRQRAVVQLMDALRRCSTPNSPRP